MAAGRLKFEINGKYMVEEKVAYGKKINLDEWLYKKVVVQGKIACNPRRDKPPGLSHGDDQEVVPYGENTNCSTGYILEVSRVSFLPTPWFHKILWFFEKTRRFVKNIYFKLLPAEEAGILTGLMLGDNQSVSPAMYKIFAASGVLHLFAASGMNLIMFGGFIRGVLNVWMKRRRAEIIAILASIFYVFLSGFSPSILRAGVMFAAAGFSSIIGRPLKAGHNLIFAVLALVFISPSLIFSLSFQLSVLATAGMILFSSSVIPASSHVIPAQAGIQTREKLDVRSMLRSDLSTTLSCFLATAPLLVFSFGELNLLAIPVNLLLLWLVEPLMLGAEILLFLSLASPLAAKCFAFIIFAPLWWFRKIATIFSNLTFGVIKIEQRELTSFLVVLCLICWTLFLIKFSKKPNIYRTQK